MADLTGWQVKAKYDEAAKLIEQAENLIADVYVNFEGGDHQAERRQTLEVFDVVQRAKIRTEDEAIAWRAQLTAAKR